MSDVMVPEGGIRRDDDRVNQVSQTLSALNKSLEIFDKDLKEEKKQRKQKKPGKKDDSEKMMSTLFGRLSEKLSGLGEQIVKGTKTASENLLKTGFDFLLGPLNLVVKPLEDFLGVNFLEMFKSLFKRDKKKEIKGKPTKKNVLPMDPGAVLIANALEKKDKKGKEGNILSGLLGTGGAGVAGIASKVFPALAKALPFASLAAGLIWMIVDGFEGWAKSEEWEVSPLAGALGSAFAGSGEGMKNAFKNAGKWALIGAGIGLLAGPIGVIAGGVLGAAIGGLLGFFGGEKVSKVVEEIGATLKQLWDSFLSYFKEKLSGFSDIWKDEESTIGEKIGKTIVEVITFIPGILFDIFEGVLKLGKNLFESIFSGKKKDSKEKESENSILKSLWDIMKDIGKGIISAIKEKIISMIDRVGKIVEVGGPWLDENIVSPVLGWLGDKISAAIEVGADVVAWVDEKLIAPVKKFFGNLWTELKNTWKLVTGWVDTNIVKPVGGFFSELADEVKGVWNSITTWVDEKVKQPVMNFFSSIGNTIDLLWLNARAAISAAITPGINQEEVQKAVGILTKDTSAKEVLKSALEEKGAIGSLASTLVRMSKVDDAIIKPSGEIIRTSPDDTIVATKSPVMQTEMMGNMAEYQMTSKKASEEQTNRIVNGLMQVVNAIQQGNNNSPQIVNATTISKRYEPTNLIEALVSSSP